MFASSILFTWLFSNTNGSILLSILYHAANNITFNLLPKLFSEINNTGIWSTIVPWFAALLVIIYYGPAHFSKKPELQQTGQMKYRDPNDRSKSYQSIFNSGHWNSP